MNKAMIFTVQIPENGKPIVYAQTASDIHKNDQKSAEKLIAEWVDNNDCGIVLDARLLEDLAYSMRKDGYAWYDETVCFELSEVYS